LHRQQLQHQQYQPHANLPGLREYISAYCSLLYYYCPCLCSCLAFFVGVILFVVMANLFFNPLEEFGIISPSISMIKSKMELNSQLNKVDHWCLYRSDKNRCDCAAEIGNPLAPKSGASMVLGGPQAYDRALEYNIKLVKENTHPNVAFIGGGLVEAMNGRWMGKSKRSVELTQIQQEYISFQSESNLDTVALGVAGTCFVFTIFCSRFFCAWIGWCAHVCRRASSPVLSFSAKDGWH